jgi:hypothetical protein
MSDLVYNCPLLRLSDVTADTDTPNNELTGITSNSSASAIIAITRRTGLVPDE